MESMIMKDIFNTLGIDSNFLHTSKDKTIYLKRPSEPCSFGVIKQRKDGHIVASFGEFDADAYPLIVPSSEH